MVSCGVDRKLVGVKAKRLLLLYIKRNAAVSLFYITVSGELVFKVSLSAAPLCMDVKGRYVALGMRDGSVIFAKASSGDVLLQFQAHADRVWPIDIRHSFPSLRYHGGE